MVRLANYSKSVLAVASKVSGPPVRLHLVTGTCMSPPGHTIMKWGARLMPSAPACARRRPFPSIMITAPNGEDASLVSHALPSQRCPGG